SFKFTATRRAQQRGCDGYYRHETCGRVHLCCSLTGVENFFVSPRLDKTCGDGAALPPIPNSEELNLLAGLDLGRDQPNFIYYLRAAGNIDHLRHILELNIRIALYEHYPFRARLEDISKPRLQIFHG